MGSLKNVNFDKLCRKKSTFEFSFPKNCIYRKALKAKLVQNKKKGFGKNTST